MPSNFKFGRGFGWIRVNIDFASLYPSTEQIGMLTGISPQNLGSFQRGYVVSPRVEDHESRVITLTSRDLSRAARDLPTEFISLEDFSQMSISRHQFQRASVVIFVDDVGTIKVLKNRYQ